MNHLLKTFNLISIETSFWSKLSEGFYNNIILEQRYLLIWDGLKTTILISLFAILTGLLLGAGICFLRMSRFRLLQNLAKTYISIIRGTPVLVILMIIFYIVFASVNIEPLIVAIIGFALNFAAYSSEIFRTGIQSIDRGQKEAGIALGFSSHQTFWQVIAPQAFRRVIPVLKGEVINLVKMTSIVGYIAVQDLTKAGDIIRSRTFDGFFPILMVAVLYFLISWTLILSIDYFEKVTDRKHKIMKRSA